MEMLLVVPTKELAGVRPCRLLGRKDPRVRRCALDHSKERFHIAVVSRGARPGKQLTDPKLLKELSRRLRAHRCPTIREGLGGCRHGGALSEQSLIPSNLGQLRVGVSTDVPAHHFATPLIQHRTEIPDSVRHPSGQLREIPRPELVRAGQERGVGRLPPVATPQAPLPSMACQAMVLLVLPNSDMRNVEALALPDPNRGLPTAQICPLRTSHGPLDGGLFLRGEGIDGYRR